METLHFICIYYCHLPILFLILLSFSKIFSIMLRQTRKKKTIFFSPTKLCHVIGLHMILFLSFIYIGESRGKEAVSSYSLVHSLNSYTGSAWTRARDRSGKELKLNPDVPEGRSHGLESFWLPTQRVGSRKLESGAQAGNGAQGSKTAGYGSCS